MEEEDEKSPPLSPLHPKIWMKGSIYNVFPPIRMVDILRGDKNTSWQMLQTSTTNVTSG